MKSYRKELHFNLPTRRGLVNITRDVQQAVYESGITEGMVLVNAMNITASTMESLLYKEALEETIVQIQRGVSLTQPIQKSGLFPPLIIHMVGIGEETGSLEEMLMNCARYYDEETELATQQVMSLMEPMIIIVMAGIVCVILGAIYGPMASMYDALGAM